MKIKSPLCITSRLMPGVEIGGDTDSFGTISIEYAYVASDGRQRYRWFIDLHRPCEAALKGDKLASGVGGGTLQEGLESLLGFLGAFAEAVAYQEKHGDQDSYNENVDLFSSELDDWAVANSGEITMLANELEEHPGEFIIET